MKKTFSLLLAVILTATLKLPALAADGQHTSLLAGSVTVKQGVVMDVKSGYVSQSDRFCQAAPNALDAITDGDKENYVDVYGLADAKPAKYVGVEFTLDGTYTLTEAAIYAGFSEYPERYRIYASETSEDLYKDESLVADDILCADSSVPAEIQLAEIKAKYIAFFCISYSVNQRIREIELFGTKYTDDTPDADQLFVSGNRIVNTKGEALPLRGVNITELSWSVYGDGSTEAGKSDAENSVRQAIDEWNCSLIRLAVNPEYYLYGGTHNGVHRTAEQYRRLVSDIISFATEENGIPVILDCHGYYGISSDVMQFWNMAANTYDQNELVMYGLLNEPVSSWEILYEGGQLPSGQVTALADALRMIRGLSDNIIVIGGVDWAFDLSFFCKDNFSEFAAERSQALGITEEEYRSRFSLDNCPPGRGIALDAHIYSHKPLNWEYYIGQAAEEYPVIAGEFGPTFLEDAAISELTDEEKSYINKIYDFIELNCAGFSAWGMNAWPYLTTPHSGGTLTAWGKSLKSFISDNCYRENIPENLLYTHFSSCRPIAADADAGTVYSSTMFYNQAYSGGEAIGSNISTLIINGDCDTHYDIYEWENHLTGIEYTLDRCYAVSELTLYSGFEGLPDRYVIYASDKAETLYSDQSIIENLSYDFTGAVSFSLDRQVKYVAILAEGYVRIKELSLSGCLPGDLNADKRLDAQDLTSLRKLLLYDGSYSASADADGNGFMNINDLIRLKKMISL